MTPPREPLHRRARYYRVPSRRRPWIGLAAVAVWLIIGAAAAIGGGAYIYLDDTLQAAAPDTDQAKAARRVTKPVLPGKPVNVLLIGADARPELGDNGRSDSLILVRMDSKAGFISMLSFPRDLWVELAGGGFGRINAAYNFGGPAATIETVSNLTGEDINDYVIVDFDGFERLVDTVGGVYIDVDRRYFNDNSSGPSYEAIDLEPGYQRLDGVDALDYVRYRHTDSDFARIARQQQFLSDLKRQTNQLGNLTKVTSFRKIFGDNIETSISSVPRFLSLLELALTTEKDRIARVSIDAAGDMRDGASVVIAAPGEVEQKVTEWKEPEFLNDATEERKVVPAETVVTVLNGSGRTLVASEMAALLRGKGYDARAGGNADDFGYSNSAVFYTAGRRPEGKALQRLVSPTATLAQIDPIDAGGGDVVVAVGTDFAGSLAPPPPPPEKKVPDVQATESLVEPFRQLQRDAGLRVLVPMKVASGSRVRRVRAYRVDTGKRKYPAAKIVFEAGYRKYWGLSMTTQPNPSILGGETGTIASGGRRYLTYYDGRNLARLAWEIDGVTYWITNSLDYELTPETIQEIAKSTRFLNRAKLAKKVTPVAIDVELDGSTP